MENFFAPEKHLTDSFVIRTYLPGDGAMSREAVTESYEHLRQWMPWATLNQRVEDAESIARDSRARYLKNEDFTLGIFNADETRLLGGTGFHLREGPLHSRCAEIGMYIRQSEAGKGLGSLVLSAMLDWGFSEWPWLRLSWRCDSRNLASVRVAEKVGLRAEGVLRGQAAEVGEGRRNTVCFALLRDEWAEKT